MNPQPRQDHAPRRWRGWPLFVAILLVTTRISGQVLDLDTVPSFPETPISVLDEVADRIVTDLPAEDLDTDTGIVRSAGAMLRRVIAELADRGRGTAPGDAAAALTSLRLAAAVDGIDARLNRLAIPGAFTGNPPLRLEEESRRRGLDRLTVFARSALDELRRRPTGTLAEFDDAMSLVLAPIVDAIETIERRPLLDRWPTEQEVLTAGVTAVPTAFPPLPDRPGLESLDRRLRERSDPESRRIHRRFREAAARSPTLDPEGPATAITRSLLDGLPGRTSSDALHRAIEMLDLATRIAADLDRIAASPARRDVDPRTLAELLASTCELDDEDLALRLLRRQATVTAMVATGSDTDLDAIDRDLRQAGRAVQRRHRRLVRATVATLIRLGSDPSALGDPEVVAALQALEQSMLDLTRLRTAGRLSSGLTAIRPGAVRQFATQVRIWCNMLGNDATAAEGAAAIDGIARDLDRFMPFPGESWLASGGRTVIERTGGRGRALLDRATETRRRWADEVSNGDLDGPARAEMERLARLGTLLMALDAILTGDDSAVARGLAACDLWGGWFVAPDRLGWTARTLAPSLQVAVSAAADGDRERLERDLVRLEAAAPPAMVVHWLSEHVAPPLNGMDAGSVGRLAAAALPPNEDAWCRSHRERIALICRAFAEIEAARSRDDVELADRLTRWTVQACDDLLDRVRFETSHDSSRDRD
jgi:hypothetical protein